MLYNTIVVNGTNDQMEYAGDLASKVPVSTYNGVGTNWRIALATDADVTLTSNISTTNPFNQVVRSINGGIYQQNMQIKVMKLSYIKMEKQYHIRH